VSIFLAFFIILRDRRRDRRKAANLLIVWSQRLSRLEDDTNERLFGFIVHAHNAGGAPLMNLHFIALKGGEILEYVSFPETRPGEYIWENDLLETGESRHETYWFRSKPSTFVRALVFRDSNGLKWYRDVESGELLGYWTMRRFDTALKRRNAKNVPSNPEF
jgi:hypothetical protein